MSLAHILVTHKAENTSHSQKLFIVDFGDHHEGNTFYSTTVSKTASPHADMGKTMPPASIAERGDLFADLSSEMKP